MSKATQAEEFRQILAGEHGGLKKMRVRMARIPAGPRCKLCMAPFGSPGGTVLRHLGFGRFPGNPAICQNCISGFTKPGMSGAGAEIPITLLFADVRGSTGLGERLSPTDFHAFLSRFYDIGSATILAHDGLVDKLVGDEIIGLFFGGVSGPGHAKVAIEAGVELLELAGRPDATTEGPIPLGAGVHTGIAYVGPTGPAGAVTDFTALGDVVNTTARLASSAGAGELLVTIDAATAADAPTAGVEHRILDVRGREATIETLVLRPAA
jgi:adenylate cyclase